MTFKRQTTVSVLGPPGTDSWGDPTSGSPVETLAASIADIAETVTDPASGRVSVSQRWEIYLRLGNTAITSQTQLQEPSGRIFEVSAVRPSPFARGEVLLLAEVRAE